VSDAVEAALKELLSNFDADERKSMAAALAAADRARAVTDEEVIDTVYAWMAAHDVAHVTVSDTMKALHAAGMKVVWA